MGKGRFLICLTSAFLAGDFIGGWLTFPPAVWLSAAIVSALLAAVKPSCVTIIIAFLPLGAASLQICRMPPQSGESRIETEAAAAKERFSAFLDGIMEEGDETAILKALAIGDKSDVDRELKNNYKKSGAMHLLALSGLHVGIIYKLLTYALFFLGFSLTLRKIRTAAILSFLWTFALISGLSPSIFRAALMITIYELSGSFGAGRDGLNALAASALIITLLDAEAPRQVGFQLSFCAVLSLMTIYPKLRRLLKSGSALLNRIWDLLAVSISCQLTTGVISWLYFGSFPIYFMVTNLLTVPLVGVVMYLIAGTLAALPFPTLERCLSAALQLSLKLLNRIVETIANL